MLCPKEFSNQFVQNSELSQNDTKLLHLWARNSNDIPGEDDVLVCDATGSSQGVGIAAKVCGDYGNPVSGIASLRAELSDGGLYHSLSFRVSPDTTWYQPLPSLLGSGAQPLFATAVAVRARRARVMKERILWVIVV